MQSNKYYQISKEASSEIGNHPGLISIQRLANKSKNILDVGCGEGTRLNIFVGKNSVGTGVDINSYAINKAKKQYPCLRFALAVGKKLPLESNHFDFVYTAFVLEHTQNPEPFIKEIIRVTKDNGNIAILCPNYGAPNRRSPVSTQKPFLKLIYGFFGDLFCTYSGLNFLKVTPKKVFRNIDDDTTCEPYLLNLLRFFKRIPGVEIKQSSSLWEIDDDAKSIHQKLFKFLGQKNIFPFKHWGPQLFVVINKFS